MERLALSFVFHYCIFSIISCAHFLCSAVVCRVEHGRERKYSTLWQLFAYDVYMGCACFNKSSTVCKHVYMSHPQLS